MPMRTPMMPITTSNSIKVKARSLRVMVCALNPAVGHSSWSDRRSLPRARITAALVGPGSGGHSRSAPHARRDLVILFLSLGLGGARTGDRSLGRGRLLLDGRLVVFRATGHPQEASAQQSKAHSIGEQLHDACLSP